MCLQRHDFNVAMKVLQEGNGHNPNSAECSLAFLGLDQILVILQFLPVQSLIAFGLTCKRFKEIAEGDSLWAFICVREWGSRAVHSWPKHGKERGGWKWVYRQMLMLKAGSWRKVEQGGVSPAPRASHSLCTVAGNLIVFGGGCQGGRHLDDTWVASLPTEISEGIVWQRSNLGSPSGRFGQSCTVVNDAIVLFGGINDQGARQCDTWIKSGLSSGNMHDSPVWELVDVVKSPPPRGAHAGCCGGDGRVVIFGGIGTELNRFCDTWVLDLAESPLIWHEVITPVSPPARSGHTMTWIGGRRMILFGGRGIRFEVLNDVWLLNMEGTFPQWVELRPCEQPLHDRPTPRAGHSATPIFGGRILIFGGEDARRSRKGDAWVLDPRAGVQVGCESSCMSSYTQKPLIEEKMAPRFWKKLKQLGQLPSRRSFHGACALDSGHSILVFGGMVDGEVLPGVATGLGFDAEMHMLQLVPCCK